MAAANQGSLASSTAAQASSAAVTETPSARLAPALTRRPRRRRKPRSAGRDGGYIMSPASALDEVQPENLKAMVDFTKEYGRYR